MNIKNHILKPGHGESVEQVSCSKTSGNFGDELPDTLVMHYTAGGSVKSAVRTLTNPEIKASAHVIIGRDGKIVQLIPFNKIAWHAGRSTYKDRTGLNRYAIGIEMDNAGDLSRQDHHYISWFNKKYTEEEVLKATHRNEESPRFWHMYTEEQIQVAFELCALLVDHYAIQYILGHEEIAPKRKTDPGPAFPLDKLRNQLINDRRIESEGENEQDIDEGTVTASKLNIRGGPASSYEKVADPLQKGTSVKILQTRDNWYRVRANIEGWVHADYIK